MPTEPRPSTVGLFGRGAERQPSAGSEPNAAPRPTIFELFGAGVQQRKATGAEHDTEQSAQRGVAMIAEPLLHAEPIGTLGKRTLTEALEPIQRKAREASLAPTGATTAAASTGAAIAPRPRAELERLFHADFSDVRVHEDDRAEQVEARAFTHGAAIHFAPGQYDPDSREGRRLLGHELAHVVQQRDGRVASPQGADGAINSNPGLEREADEQGERAAAGEPARAASAPSLPSGLAPAIQCMAFEFRGAKYDTTVKDQVEALCQDLVAKGDREGLELLRVILQRPRKAALPEDADEKSIAAAIQLVEAALRALGESSVTPRLFDPGEAGERGGAEPLDRELHAFRDIVDTRPANERTDPDARRFPPTFFDPAPQEMKPLLLGLPTRYGTDENLARILQTPDAAHASTGAQPSGPRKEATMQEAQEAIVGLARARTLGIPGDQVERATDRRSDVTIKGKPFDVKSPRDPGLPSSLPPMPEKLEGLARPSRPKVPGGGDDFKERREAADKKFNEDNDKYGAAVARDNAKTELHGSYVAHHDGDPRAIGKRRGEKEKHLKQDTDTIAKKIDETGNDILLDETYASTNYRRDLSSKLGQRKVDSARIHSVDLHLDEEYVHEDLAARQELAERYHRARAEAKDPVAFDEQFRSPDGKELRKQVLGGKDGSTGAPVPITRETSRDDKQSDLSANREPEDTAPVAPRPHHHESGEKETEQDRERDGERRRLDPP